MILDWLIVGGGPHGVHVAASLIAEAGVSPESLAILDDEQELLARWRRCTRNSGMRYLRSPAVHHLDPSTRSLQQFAKSSPGRQVKKPFTRPYSRPSLKLFDLHCDQVIERFGLEDLHIRGRANNLDLSDEHIRVGFAESAANAASGELEAQNVVLALGAPQDPHWPEWASHIASEARRVQESAVVNHIFDPGLEHVDAPKDETIAVVGAGISGVQVAIQLAHEGRRVVLLSRHPIRVHQFDSDPGWQGPKFMTGYSRLTDQSERRVRIQKARHTGSIPPDIHAALRCALASETMELLENTEVQSAGFSEGRVSLDLGNEQLVVDRVLLATGFQTDRPGAHWLDQAIQTHNLPCAKCGYPIVDQGLRWHPHLFVSGSLAELEIGPVSRNLSGAQRAAERIVATTRESLNDQHLL